MSTEQTRRISTIVVVIVIIILAVIVLWVRAAHKNLCDKRV